METVVIALGGNAVLQPGQRGTFEEQLANVATTARAIRLVLEDGYSVVVTHGNGPQVGNIMLQNEEARGVVPPFPLDACGAESQGLLGYMLVRSLISELRTHGLERAVVALMTMTVVSPEDPAFQNPTKPIGPFYSQARAIELIVQRGYEMREDSGRGWRRVVPSPDPLEIVEAATIRRLVEEGVVVVASGGGGIPVVRTSDGGIAGVEAVIDKDLAAHRLAEVVDADVLLILTDVEAAALNYGTPAQKALVGRVPYGEMLRYQREGHFRAGSMGPKVEAALRFVGSCRGRKARRAVIASLYRAREALRGEAGTCIVGDEV